MAMFKLKMMFFLFCTFCTSQLFMLVFCFNHFREKITSEQCETLSMDASDISVVDSYLNSSKHYCGNLSLTVRFSRPTILDKFIVMPPKKGFKLETIELRNVIGFYVSADYNVNLKSLETISFFRVFFDFYDKRSDSWLSITLRI